MPLDPPGLLMSEPDNAVVEKLAVAERAALAVVAATVLVSATEWFLPALRDAFSPAWGPLSGQAWCATAACAIALYLAHPRFSDRIHQFSIALGALTAVGSAAAFIALLVRLLSGRVASGIDRPIHLLQLHLSSRMSPQAGAGFLMLGLAIVFLQAKKRCRIAADIVCWLMALVVLTLSSAQVVGSISLFGPVVQMYSSHQTMLCMFLLGFVAMARRSRNGVLRIFLGPGIGSRVSRALAPFLLILPYIREGMRGRLLNAPRMPSHYTTALLASMAGVISVALLLYLAWRFNALEAEVHDLSLRDPLTDLYNLRGFRFLAEQALRLSRRSGQPFSLLFIDVDGLKQVNDELGHQTGSEFLVQTSEILKETFRETDVMGRIGGDEFAVAGQFSGEAILFASRRLLEAARQRNAVKDYELPLSFSIGHVTSEPGRVESLEEMLASADEAMYQVKRQRKAVLR